MGCPCQRAIPPTHRGVPHRLTPTLTPPDCYPNFNSTSPGESMTLKCTQLLRRLLGNNSMRRKRRQRLLSLLLHSGARSLPSTYSGKTNSAVNSNKRRRSRHLQTKLRVNRDTNNIHSTGTISNIRINRKLLLLPMGTSKRTQGASQLQKKAARAGNLRDVRFSDWIEHICQNMFSLFCRRNNLTFSQARKCDNGWRKQLHKVLFISVFLLVGLNRPT